jgi:hypothetical protein
VRTNKRRRQSKWIERKGGGIIEEKNKVTIMAYLGL